MNSSKKAVASLEFLEGLFKVPEHEKATLYQLEKVLSENLNEFLTQKKVAGEIPLDHLSRKYSSVQLPKQPSFVSDHIDYLLQEVIPFCVHTGSPKFIGHMTSALPYFLHSLSKCMVALHQNVVKIETSRSFTLLERQTLGILHNLIYRKSKSFYQSHTHHRYSSLGIQCSGGTSANIIALWIARNAYIKKVMGKKSKGCGLIDALQKDGKKNLCVFVSERGHYSIKKAADLLGFGQHSCKVVPVTSKHKMHLPSLKKMIRDARQQNLHPLCLIGIAGSTETGSVDALKDLAKVAEDESLYYHIDAAWGGPTLFSDKHEKIMSGIELADSVAIDGHKQLYLPMGVGMILFKDPMDSKHIEQEAQYIIREGSFDLGKRSLEGSRPGMALLVHAALHIFGKRGYELLMDQNITRAKQFASLIKKRKNFELITKPELNLLTYRFNPFKNNDGDPGELNELNTRLQKEQRELGQSFVSRTKFRHPEPKGPVLTVLRAVLANPLTKPEHFKQILDEQENIVMKIIKGDRRAFPKFKRWLKSNSR